MNWKTELLLGLLMLAIGAVLSYKFNPKIITVLEGAVPLLMLIIGGLFLWIAYEDRLVEAELRKIEEELEKEKKSAESSGSSA